MVKRIAIVGGLTGAAHGITLVVISILSRYIPVDQLAGLGEVDALLMLVLVIVSFGLQLSTNRDIANTVDWKPYYERTQQARFTLSMLLLLIGLGLGVWSSSHYFLLCMAPLIGLNGDYALYGKGLPEKAAWVAFLRVLIPSLAAILLSIWARPYLIQGYVISVGLAYGLSGFLTAGFLEVSYFFRLSLKSLKHYLHTLNLGVSSLALFFVGVGILNVATYFYPDGSIGAAYVALKLYMIYKGVRRIIVQAFFNVLRQEIYSLKVDQLAMLSAGGALLIFGLFPGTSLPLLYDEQYIAYKALFQYAALAALFASVSTSLGTRLLLHKKDKAYTRNLLVAVGVTLLSMVLYSFIWQQAAKGITLSVATGELVLSILHISASEKWKKQLSERLKFSGSLLLLLGLPWLLRFLLGDSLWGLGASMGLFISLAAGLHLKKFRKGTLNYQSA